MNNIQSQVKEFMLAAKQACPDSPQIPPLESRILRCRLSLEEVLEFIEASGLELKLANPSFYDKPLEMKDFEIAESETPPDIIEVADSIADLSYVNYGAANTWGIDMEPIELEVHRNNMTKFDGGWVDEHGKLRKGPNYKPVDLSAFFPEVSKN